tara:strand:- start:615 stop:1643 length:1029 start_codon:yes stop_codon:yes gene_type:complete
MSKFSINQISNKHGNYGPVVAGVATVNSTGAMRIPSGNTGMRVEYNTVNDNDIVRDGLILHLDFANPDCLINGSTVSDLSGAGIVDSGTISGATYSPDGGGSLYFDNRGGIDFGLIDPNGPFLLSGTSSSGDKLSCCSWVGNVDMTRSANVVAAVWHSTSAAGWLIAANETAADSNRPQPSVIVSDGADGTGAWARPGWNGPNIPEYDPRHLNYWQTVKSINSGIGNTTVAVGKDKFNHLGQTLARWTYTTNGVAVGWGTRNWINGLKNGMATPLYEDSAYGYTTETGDWGSASRSLRIGRDDNSSGSYMKGNIAVVMIYNRELTHAEMQQNYNAQRYRFGR